MDDLISRLSEIRSNYNCFDETEEPYYRALSEAIQLASVQPEIIRCKDCKYADDDGVCQNSVGLAIQDDDDFCSRAERRIDEQT